MKFKKEEEKLQEEIPEKKSGLIAKKDFVIHQNEIHIEIKEGDDLEKKVPKKFLENLKTEGVL